LNPALVNPPDHVQQFRKRLDGEVCPNLVFAEETIVAVNAKGAGRVGHLDVRTVVAHHQDFARRDLEVIHQEVESGRVGLQVRESISARNVIESPVQPVLSEKSVHEFRRLV